MLRRPSTTLPNLPVGAVFPDPPGSIRQYAGFLLERPQRRTENSLISGSYNKLEGVKSELTLYAYRGCKLRSNAQ